MSDARPSYDDLLTLVQQQQRQIEALRADVARLRAALDQAQRAGKRQAAPFRKGPPNPAPKPPGREAGDRHGTHAHRRPPPTEQITEVLEAPLPDACPDCGGSVAEADVAHPYQTELPRQPIRRQFNVHVGCCRQCGRRLQGRHPLQTSDALGAAASQLGPDARAALVTLNKDAGLSHGKVAACPGAPVGIDLTRGASAQVVRRAASRLEPAYEEIRQATRAADRLAVDETGWRLGGEPAWLHAWVSERATCYTVDRRRSADALERVIGPDWGGVLIHDGFASYDRFTGAVHQQCVAHLLRRAREAGDGHPRGGAVPAPGHRAVHRRGPPAERVPGRPCRGRRVGRRARRVRTAAAPPAARPAGGGEPGAVEPPVEPLRELVHVPDRPGGGGDRTTDTAGTGRRRAAARLPPPAAPAAGPPGVR